EPKVSLALVELLALAHLEAEAALAAPPRRGELPASAGRVGPPRGAGWTGESGLGCATAASPRPPRSAFGTASAPVRVSLAHLRSDSSPSGCTPVTAKPSVH